MKYADQHCQEYLKTVSSEFDRATKTLSIEYDDIMVPDQMAHLFALR
jgi:hypothetical protein